MKRVLFLGVLFLSGCPEVVVKKDGPRTQTVLIHAEIEPNKDGSNVQFTGNIRIEKREDD